MAFIRNDQADIYLTVAGVQYGGTWATYSGGAVSATDAKTRSGGMGKEKSIGGPATRSDVTITIQEDETVLGWHPTLESLVGRGDIVALVSVQYLQPNTHVMQGAKFGRRGTLKEAMLADKTYADGNASFYTVTVSADEDPV